MSQKPTALVLDPAFKDHTTAWGHPESPARVDAIRRGLERDGLADSCLRVSPRDATDDELARAHDPVYISEVLQKIESGASHLAGGDVSVGPRSGRIARLAAGAAVRAVESVMSGDARNAFCVVRPPGHHATQERAMGFCIFNNVAVAARHAQAACGAGRVAILDWDVHHGNGTQDIFYEDGTIFFASTHQSPHYPGTGDRTETGRGPGEGSTRNCPFPAGARRHEILGAFREEILPAVRRFAPDLILLSAGFDSRRGDPLGGFLLDDEDFRDLTTDVMRVADETCGGRVVSVLEGGYSLEGLAAATAAHVAALAAG